jgi:hypothetical protein
MDRSPELLIEPAPGVLQAARRWVDRIHPVLGPDFVAAYVTGSALTQGWSPSRSDVNVLVVARRLDAETLDRLAPLVSMPARAPHIAPLFLTETQIQRSLDVYPMEFLDLHERHLLLEGENVLSDLRVSRTDLRLQCERELRSRLIELRQTYLLKQRSPTAMAESLSSMAAGWNVLFRALLRLRGEEVPAHNARVIERVADLFGLPAEGLLGAYVMRYGAGRPRPSETRQRFLAFVLSVESLVTVLDGLPLTAGPEPPRS